ncbi:MAG: DUF6873 family GME fold protein [Bacteroidales bacterium]|jgi:hypothetical protein
MLIIVDKKIPGEAKEKLSAYLLVRQTDGNILELETEGIVYPAISGHPDIFFCKTPQVLIVSPSLPNNYLQKINEQRLQYVLGNKASSIQHPASVHYNAAVNDHYLVHRLEYTDPVILQNCHTLKKIPVKQSYTRCNLMLLKDDHYITSDRGIHKNLQRSGLEGIFVSPEGILLPGFPNGFIGGVMGLLNDSVFVIGSLSHFSEGAVVKKFLEELNYRIVELYKGPLFDGGGILFLS